VSLLIDALLCFTRTQARRFTRFTRFTRKQGQTRYFTHALLALSVPVRQLFLFMRYFTHALLYSLYSFFTRFTRTQGQTRRTRACASAVLVYASLYSCFTRFTRT
jgi:hypothetical protein